MVDGIRIFKQTLLLVFVVVSLPSCKSTDSNLKHGPSGVCLVKGTVAPAGVCESQDGLVLLGDEFDPLKPSVIFIHGWIPSYELGVPDFVNEQGWSSAGYNPFIFRFINDAVDPGEGEICRVAKGEIPLFDLIEIKCPRYAEPRVWKKNGITDDFTISYGAFFKNYPSYDQEIRIVGHSLGGQIAVSSALALNAKKEILAKPQRVELIDPWLGYGPLDTGRLDGPYINAFPDWQGKPSSRCSRGNQYTSYCAVENGLHQLNKDGVALVIYGSNAAGAFAYDLRKFFNYQAFNENWLCGKDVLGSGAKCLFRAYSMFTAQHFYPLFSYFWSINESIPEGGVTARTPTSELIGQNISTKQRSQFNWCNLPNGVDFWKEGGLDHVFGMSRYPGFLNRGIQDTTDSRLDFTDRISTYLPFSKSQAEQCAAAISFENDRFDPQ